MSVADLFAVQQLYNQQGLYQDTTQSNQAWKTAFDIANNFATTAEKFRAHDENMQTSANRVGAMNAENQQRIDLAPYETQAGIAKANYDVRTLPARAAYDISRYGDFPATEAARRAELLAKYGWNETNSNVLAANAQGGLDLANWLAANRVDPLTGAIRNNMELMTLAQQQGLDKRSPIAFGQLISPAQQFLQTSANHIAPYSPKYASETRALGGLSDTMLNEQGQVIDATSGNVIGQIPQQAQAYYAAGTAPQAPKVNQSNQVDLRTKQAQFFKIQEASKVDGIFNKEAFDRAVADVAAVYGENDPELIQFYQNTLRANGLSVPAVSAATQQGSTTNTVATPPTTAVKPVAAPATPAVAPTQEVLPEAKPATVTPPPPPVALTPEQNRAALIESLNRHQAQAELEHSLEYRRAQELKRQQAVKSVMERANNPALPYYLQSY